MRGIGLRSVKRRKAEDHMGHKGYYTSGEFAKKANVTIRTVRYYDKQGILKPSRISEAGYRLYTDEDFIRLQKILSLKYLGFSLEEIAAMTINDGAEDISRSLMMQRELIQKRIRHLQMMEQTIEDTALMMEESKSMDWNSILNLIHITNMEHALVDQYKTAVNLNVRIELHRRFSNNPQPWFAWLASQINLDNAHSILEIGCGNGELWQQVDRARLTGKRIRLTDISPGMVEDAEELLRDEIFTFETADCQKLIYEDHSFDCVIANHVLFYVKNLNQALKEVNRVMSPDGVFCCSTYGRGHMKEITSLVREFDSGITLSEVALFEMFGLENGEEILKEHFENVEKVMYDDCLLVDEAEPLLNYILSCHGNQSEKLSQRQLEFKAFLQKKMKEHGGIHITKMAGIFICRGKFPKKR